MSCFQGGRGRAGQVGRGNVRVIVTPGPFEITCPLTQALSWNVDINSATGKAHKEWAKAVTVGEDSTVRIWTWNGTHWTTVDKRSTPGNPMLNCPPQVALRRMFAAMPRCPAVSNIVLKDEHGNVLSLEQACALNYHALADQAQPELDEPLEPDGYFLNNEIQTLKSDLHDLKAKYEALEMQVAAISGK